MLRRAFRECESGGSGGGGAGSFRADRWVTPGESTQVTLLRAEGQHLLGRETFTAWPGGPPGIYVSEGKREKIFYSRKNPVTSCTQGVGPDRLDWFPEFAVSKFGALGLDC